VAREVLSSFVRVLNYNHLYYFHVAATEGSLVAAAAKLGVTQSTVSEQLRALERAIRKTLFERSSTGMRLTPSGRIVYEHTAAIFRTGERLEQLLSDEPDDSDLSLRVGTSGAVARATSTDFLLPLFALEQTIPIIRIGEAVDLLRDLRGNDLDLVLCETEPPASALDGLEHVVVDHIPLVAIIASDASVDAHWADVGLVQYRTSSSFHWDVAGFLEAQDLRPKIVGEADDPFLLVEAAAQGGHIAIVPATVARDSLAAGRVRVLARLDSAHAGVHALYQDGTATDYARQAIERLIAAAQRSDQNAR
jgi:LysR family transcriptional regulator, transcriptional activator of nhaA